MAKPKPDKWLSQILGTDKVPLPPSVVALQGFVVESPYPGYWRLYRTTALDAYLDIADADVLGSETLDPAFNGLGGTILWVSREAMVAATRMVEARFLAGKIADTLASGTEETGDGEGGWEDPGPDTKTAPCG